MRLATSGLLPRFRWFGSAALPDELGQATGGHPRSRALHCECRTFASATAPLSLSWAIFRDVLPDVFSFAIPALVRMWWSPRYHDFIPAARCKWHTAFPACVEASLCEHSIFAAPCRPTRPPGLRPGKPLVLGHQLRCTVLLYSGMWIGLRGRHRLTDSVGNGDLSRAP